jgi:membrane protease YdiL (CAAX protease family)
MWENFRARLPFLFDPWSEKVPPPPTLMHAMIAISALVEGGALITGVCILLLGLDNIAIAQGLGFAFVAVIVSLVTASMLASRGVKPEEVWCWRSAQTVGTSLNRWWWSGDGARNRRFLISILIGAVGGLLLGLLANGYLILLSRFGPFAEMMRVAQEQFETVPNLRSVYAVIAIVFAPFAEEYLFRGLLYRALDRAWGGWRALLGSAAFFAIYHQPLAWLPVFLAGVGTALVFKKTGRLASAVALHMAYNAVVI